jgi:hypothetical protein
MAVGGPVMAAGIAALGRRRLIAHSARILARDDRGAHPAAEAGPPR